MKFIEKHETFLQRIWLSSELCWFFLLSCSLKTKENQNKSCSPTVSGRCNLFCQRQKVWNFPGRCNSSHRWRKINWLGRGWMSMLSCCRAEVLIRWLTPWGKRQTCLIFAVLAMVSLWSMKFSLSLVFLQSNTFFFFFFRVLHLNECVTMENKPSCLWIHVLISSLSCNHPNNRGYPPSSITH